jgi:hypothetical protein
MATLSSLIFRLRADLGFGTDDDEAVDQLLIDDINSGICAVQQLRPELFAKSKIVKLQAGDEQSIDDCGCDLLMRVEAVTTEDGRKLADVRVSSTRLRGIASRLALCGSRTQSKGFNDYTATLDPVILNRFTVNPPVQGDVWMRVLCSGVDKFLSDKDADADMPCAIYELVLSWAKMQASRREVDSASAQAASAAAMTMFTSMVKGFKAGNYGARV